MDPLILQAVADTVTLLKMLIMTPNQILQVATLTNELANATYQIEAFTNELASSETAINMLHANLTEVKQITATLTGATPDGGRGGSDKEHIPIIERFDGIRSKLRAFLPQL